MNTAYMYCTCTCTVMGSDTKEYPLKLSGYSRVQIPCGQPDIHDTTITCTIAAELQSVDQNLTILCTVHVCIIIIHVGIIPHRAV